MQRNPATMTRPAISEGASTSTTNLASSNPPRSNSSNSSSNLLSALNASSGKSYNASSPSSSTSNDNHSSKPTETERKNRGVEKTTDKNDVRPEGTGKKAPDVQDPSSSTSSTSSPTTSKSSSSSTTATTSPSVKTKATIARVRSDTTLTSQSVSKPPSKASSSPRHLGSETATSNQTAPEKISNSAVNNSSKSNNSINSNINNNQNNQNNNKSNNTNSGSKIIPISSDNNVSYATGAVFAVLPTHVLPPPGLKKQPIITSQAIAIATTDAVPPPDKALSVQKNSAAQQSSAAIQAPNLNSKVSSSAVGSCDSTNSTIVEHSKRGWLSDSPPPLRPLPKTVGVLRYTLKEFRDVRGVMKSELLSNKKQKSPKGSKSSSTPNATISKEGPKEISKESSKERSKESSKTPSHEEQMRLFEEERQRHRSLAAKSKAEDATRGSAGMIRYAEAEDTDNILMEMQKEQEEKHKSRVNKGSSPASSREATSSTTTDKGEGLSSTTSRGEFTEGSMPSSQLTSSYPVVNGSSKNLTNTDWLDSFAIGENDMGIADTTTDTLSLSSSSPSLSSSNSKSKFSFTSSSSTSNGYSLDGIGNDPLDLGGLGMDLNQLLSNNNNNNNNNSSDQMSFPSLSKPIAPITFSSAIEEASSPATPWRLVNFNCAIEFDSGKDNARNNTHDDFPVFTRTESDSINSFLSSATHTSQYKPLFEPYSVPAPTASSAVAMGARLDVMSALGFKKEEDKEVLDGYGGEGSSSSSVRTPSSPEACGVSISGGLLPPGTPPAKVNSYPSNIPPPLPSSFSPPSSSSSSSLSPTSTSTSTEGGFVFHDKTDRLAISGSTKPPPKIMSAHLSSKLKKKPTPTPAAASATATPSPSK